MDSLNYIVLVLYFLGLIAVSWLMSRRIKSSEDMFIAGRSSSWWLSGMSTYMTIFSASTFVVWGGVAFRSGLVAVIIGNLVGVACLITGRWVAGKWRQIKINSPGDFIAVRFGKTTVDFYTIAGIIGRGVHTGVALYAIAVVMSTLMTLPEGHILADANGHLSISCAVIILGVITLIYTVAGGFLAVLMTDVIQFGVLIAVVLFMIPLSLHAIGGLDNFINSPSLPSSYFDLTSTEYPWIWLILWTALNVFQMGGDWPFVQRYISVPTARDARRSNYLVGILYLFTPVLWYLPAMVYRSINPDANPEQAYILMSQTVLMKGMLGVMLAAMISATLSCVSGTLNVYANVFTYQIYGAARPDASDRSLIKAGRIFTVAFGVAIIAIALLIPPDGRSRTSGGDNPHHGHSAAVHPVGMGSVLAPHQRPPGDNGNDCHICGRHHSEIHSCRSGQQSGARGHHRASYSCGSHGYPSAARLPERLRMPGLRQNRGHGRPAGRCRPPTWPHARP